MQDSYDADKNHLDRGFSPCLHCTTGRVKVEVEEQRPKT